MPTQNILTLKDKGEINISLHMFSPNMLKTFDLCPRKFNFRYIKNITMPQNDDIFEFGKNIHALASYYLRNENVDKMELVLTPKEKEVWDYLKSMVYFGYEVINTEYSLSVKIGDYYFGGRLDAIVKNNDKYYILDYKTGSAPKSATYDYQTMIYLLAVSEFYKTDNIEFVYIDLKNKNEVCIEFNSDLKKEYREKLISISNKINTIEATIKKENCHCEYDKICY